MIIKKIIFIFLSKLIYTYVIKEHILIKHIAFIM